MINHTPCIQRYLNVDTKKVYHVLTLYNRGGWKRVQIKLTKKQVKELQEIEVPFKAA